MKRPSVRAVRAHTWDSWTRLVVVLAALSGVFAMHALSDHGPAGAPPGVAHVAAGHSEPVTYGDSQLVDTSVGTMAAGPGISGDGHTAMGLMGLCFAVLGGLVLAFVLLRDRRYRAVPRLAALAQLFWPAAARRDPDPPCLKALSIRRC